MFHKRWIFGRSKQLRAINTAECFRWYSDNKRAQHEQGRWAIDLVGSRKESHRYESFVMMFTLQPSCFKLSFKLSKSSKRWQPVATSISPEDINNWIMALAWPSFQPITLPSVLRAWSMSSGFIIMICPVDKPVLSFPSAEIDVASMLSPKLLAKAAETYTGNMKHSFVHFSEDPSYKLQICTVCGYLWV